MLSNDLCLILRLCRLDNRYTIKYHYNIMYKLVVWYDIINWRWCRRSSCSWYGYYYAFYCPYLMRITCDIIVCYSDITTPRRSTICLIGFIIHKNTKFQNHSIKILKTKQVSQITLVEWTSLLQLLETKELLKKTTKPTANQQQVDIFPTTTETTVYFRHMNYDW